MVRKLVLLSLAVVLLGGCAKTFTPAPFSADDQQFAAMLQESGDFDSRLLLGRMHFMHNHLEEADALLGELVTEDPEHAEALAWYGANNCKLAGRAFPWALGFYKLYRVNACLNQVEEAARRAPDDLTVQLVLINTGAEVNMFGVLAPARAARDRLAAAVETRPQDYTPEVLSHFYLAAAKLEQAADNPQEARTYLKRVMELNAGPDLVSEAHMLLVSL